jgi:hypothetical protein
MQRERERERERELGGGEAQLVYVKAGGTYCSHYALNGQTLCCVNVMATIRVKIDNNVACGEQKFGNISHSWFKYWPRSSFSN